MTKHQFKTLCQRILIPLIEVAIRKEQSALQEELDIISRALANMERQLERIEQALPKPRRRRPE